MKKKIRIYFLLLLFFFSFKRKNMRESERFESASSSSFVDVVKEASARGRGGCLCFGIGRRAKRSPSLSLSTEEMATQTGLSVKEVRALEERFFKIAPRGFMTKEQFRSTLGMLGMTPNDYIPNRMFSVFDKDKDGVLTFPEYLCSFAVLLRGSEEERMQLSFHLADSSGTGRLNFSDFEHLLTACLSTTSALLESGDSVAASEMQQMFFEISQGEAFISLERYGEAIRTNARFLSILGLSTGGGTKPPATNVSSAPETPSPAPLPTGGKEENIQLRTDLTELMQELINQNADSFVIEKISDILNRQIRRSRPTSPVPVGVNKAGSDGTVLKKGRRIFGPRKGLAVHFGHENWNMVLSMMIGIRLAVGRASFEINRPLTSVDFDVKDKFSIVPQMTNFLDSKVSSKVKVTRFIDYAPLVFRKLREELAGITEEDYMRSVGPEQLLGNMVLGSLSSLAELTTEGKGGAFFYYTADGRFMIKTVSSKEKRLLKEMLKEYFYHLKNNKDSLIVRFYGLHGLRVKRDPIVFRQGKYRSDEKIFFLVMGNLFNTPLEVHKRFDLKGSWVGRSVGRHPTDPTVALKDNDFVDRGETVQVGPELKAHLCTLIRKDVEFFSKHNILDYSLLLGIHDVARPASTGGSQSAAESPAGLARGYPSTDGSRVYYLGIIDILCQYDAKKKLETFFKSIRYDRKGISAIPPQDYAERFLDFISSHVE